MARAAAPILSGLRTSISTTRSWSRVFLTETTHSTMLIDGSGRRRPILDPATSAFGLHLILSVTIYSSPYGESTGADSRLRRAEGPGTGILEEQWQATRSWR